MATGCVEDEKEGTTNGGSSESLDNTFQEVAHELARTQEVMRQEMQNAHDRIQETLRQRTRDSYESMQETLRQQMQDANNKMQEIFRRQEQRTKERLETITRVVDSKFTRVDQVLLSLTSKLDEGLRRIEERVGVMDRRLSATEKRASVEEIREHGPLAHLEDRLKNLESSIQRALEMVFPCVEAMVTQWEGPSNIDSPPLSPHRSTSDSSQISDAVSSSSLSSPLATHFSSSVSARVPFTRIPLPASEDRRNNLKCALFMWVSKGIVKKVRKLLDEGGDVNFSNKSEWTLLMCAANRDYADVVSLLLERGADVCAKAKDGLTALHLAAYVDHDGRCVSLLIGAGADIDCRDENGETPLHKAMRWNNKPAIRTLLAAGADKTLRNNKGKLPSEVKKYEY